VAAKHDAIKLVKAGRMNSSEIVHARLHNQRLSSPDFNKPVDVLHWFGAMQAQDFNGAKWALAQRMRDATNTLIEKAFNEGKILRTHVMRPTWHFVAPDDIRWMLQLTASRVNLGIASNYRKFELDERTFTRCHKAITRVLQNRQYLNRANLKTVINQAGVAADNPIRLAHILLRAELDGVICSGPRLKNQFTYALLDERVRHTKVLHREESLAKLTRRYFTSHGPATLRDFVWWSGLTIADAKLGLELAHRHLTKIITDSEVYWASKDVVPAHQPSTSACLLPAFDEYVIAYKDRKAVLGDNKTSRTENLIFGSMIILDGKIAGSWKASNDKNAVIVALKPFRALKATQKFAIGKEIDRYARFHDSEVRPSW